MNLKEACRYAGYLNKVLGDLNNAFIYGRDMEGAMFTVTEDHMKKDANPDKEDEIGKSIDLKKTYEITIEQVLELYEKVLLEKTVLSNKISKAKEKLHIDWEEDGEKLSIDTAIEQNKQMRTYCSYVLDTLKKVKESETKRYESDYKINIEGNQVIYKYEVIQKKELNFDKKLVLDKRKKLLDKADKISEMIEQANLKDIIEFKPIFDIHSSLEELIEDFVEVQKK